MAEIEKIAVYDARIIQDPPKYAVQKGALSVSTSQFQANAANASQLSFQVLVPSLNVFTDRKIELNASAFCYAEAVPSQQVSLYSATTGPNAIPQGRYIDSPITEAQQYIGQSDPIMATFPPDGTTYIGEGNTASVLPANSWSGLDETSTTVTPAPGGGGDDEEVTNFITTASTDPSTWGDMFPITAGIRDASGEPTAPAAVNFTLTNASLRFVNPFAQFNGVCSGTFDYTYQIYAELTNVYNSQSQQISYQFELRDSTNAQSNTVFASSPIISQSSFEESNHDSGDPFTFYSNAVGQTSFAINSSAISADTVTHLQVWVRLFVSGVNQWIFVRQASLVYNEISNYTSQSFVFSGFNTSAATGGSGGGVGGLGSVANRNWYQSIGSPYDISLGMFPIQSLATSMTATINDCSVSVSGDVLREQLLISQTRDSLMQRTCPSKYDVYAWAADDARSANGALQSYQHAIDSDIPNGSYPLVFVHPQTGQPFAQFDAYRFTNSAGQLVTVPIINFRPAFIPYGSNLIGQSIPSPSLTNPSSATYVIKPTDCTTPYPIMFRFQTVEPLCLSPFLWQDSKQMTEVGLYGITNMTVNMTLTNPGPVVGYETGSSVIQNRQRGRLYMDKINNSNGSYGYMTRQSGINALYGNMRLQPPANNAGNQTGPWVTTPRLLCTFLTPPPEITLPLVSSVPYVEFPRYTSTASVSFTTSGSAIVTSNTVTLSSIPDLLVVFVKPAYRGQTQGDTYIPIQNIGVTFDNYANLCSNYSQEDLYACSVAGGLDMDFNQFRGFARSKYPTSTPKSSGAEGSKFDTYTSNSANVQLTGAPVILRMGQDIPLSSGLAPGTLGNYSVQVQVVLDNSNGFFSYMGQIPNSNNVTVTIMGVNSGFFESVRGSSAIRKTILNTNDVEAASTSSSVTSAQLVRLVGGASGMHTSSRLTTSLAGLPSFKAAIGEDSRVRKMARTLGSMIP